MAQRNQDSRSFYASSLLVTFTIDFPTRSRHQLSIGCLLKSLSQRLFLSDSLPKCLLSSLFTMSLSYFWNYQGRVKGRNILALQISVFHQFYLNPFSRSSSASPLLEDECLPAIFCPILLQRLELLQRL